MIKSILVGLAIGGILFGFIFSLLPESLKKKIKDEDSNKDKSCHFPDDGCIHTSTSQKGSCEWCELFY